MNDRGFADSVLQDTEMNDRGLADSVLPDTTRTEMNDDTDEMNELKNEDCADTRIRTRIGLEPTCRKVH